MSKIVRAFNLVRCEITPTNELVIDFVVSQNIQPRFMTHTITKYNTNLALLEAEQERFKLGFANPTEAFIEELGV